MDIPIQYGRITRNEGSPVRYWTRNAALLLPGGGGGTVLTVSRGSDEILVRDGDVIVTDIAVAWKPTASGVGKAAWLQLNPAKDSTVAMVLGVITTTADWTVYTWHGSALVDWTAFNTTDTVFELNHTTGNFPATDLFVVTISGMVVSKIQTDISPTAVSLEGYKWPLSRR